jgi:hypothetical protein
MTFQSLQGAVFRDRVPMPARVGTAIDERGRVVLAARLASSHAHPHEAPPAAQRFEGPNAQRDLVSIQRYQPVGIGDVLE